MQEARARAHVIVELQRWGVTGGGGEPRRAFGWGDEKAAMQRGSRVISAYYHSRLATGNASGPGPRRASEPGRIGHARGTTVELDDEDEITDQDQP